MASVNSSDSSSTGNAGGKANAEIGTDSNNILDLKKQGPCDDQSESPEKTDATVDNESSENRLMSMSQAEKSKNNDTFNANGSNLTATAASSQPDKVSPTSSRPNLQAKKRRPDKELNHDNWDQEDEPEEKGEFKKASEDQLKDRKILTARRKQKPASGTSSNPFGNLAFGTGFGVGGGNMNPAPVFNFSNIAAPVATPKFDFGLLNTEANTKETNKALTNECVNANEDSKVSYSPSTKLNPDIKKDGEPVESGADVGNNSATNV